MDYSNNVVSGVSGYALLAKLAYKKLPNNLSFLDQINQRDSIKIDGAFENFNSYFTARLSNEVNENYDLIETFEDINTGFFAALVRDASGQYTLTIRGTEFENDFNRDFIATNSMIATHGMALPQVVSLQHALNRIESENLTNGQSIHTTGHSLGGHLALLAEALAPDLVDQVYTFNAPHVYENFLRATISAYNNAPETAYDNYTLRLSAVFAIFGPETVFADWDFEYELQHHQLYDQVLQNAGNFISQLTTSQNDFHIYETYGDVVSEIGSSKFGETQLIYSEHENDVSSAPHSQSEITTALLMHDVFNAIDNTLTANDIGQMLLSSANIGFNEFRNPSTEAIVRALVKYFPAVSYSSEDVFTDERAEDQGSTGWNVEYANHSALQTALLDLRDQIQAAFSGNGTVANMAASDTANLALQNTDEGRAYRFALVHALPFAITTGVANTAAASSDYDLANYTEQYLQDRAQYLSNLLHYNTIDADVDYETIVPNIQDLAFYSDPQTTSLVTFTSDSGEPIVIDETLKTSLGDDDAYRHFIFDNDEDNDQLNGKDQNDHIYGAGGNDTLDGGKGNDYLEGGTGHDTYQFNYGDGRDRIVDNGAADEKNKLFITHTDGGTASQVSRLALLAGSSVYQEVDAAGDVINPATTYALISNAAGQDSLLITVDGGKGGSITHQFDNGFAQWSSAFLCMSKETNQRKRIPPSSPEGALTFDKNKRSALCHIPVAKRLKSTSCCLNPLFVSTLDLMKGKLAA
jgi:Ca2+-binding RTX toxin-like protein